MIDQIINTLFKFKIFEMSTFVTFSLSFLLVLSIFDMMKAPVTAKVTGYWIEDITHPTPVTVTTWVPLKPMDVITTSPGTMIHLSSVVTRHRQGEGIFDRILLAQTTKDEFKEYTLSSTTKQFGPEFINKKIEIEGQYRIPSPLSPGCFYKIYSKSHYTYSWNILTKIKPVYVETEKIDVCIVPPTK